ncbi:hypothetical protein HOT99_gp037 [Caulobacter phage CcrBL10]|uniref:Uncharacterized protein n=1 Tax=Caulobacter phage CcrBL10 TaxID=2283269 RepID=A0A385E8S4_9CAUD|nr:hypothetical protein HOT99_gp037 [Caulobacter phage CcrBL10]AXQ68241.1 hypothetical protein CcrBL10_gp037 [Caulobacter phage CcrBL10]
MTDLHAKFESWIVASTMASAHRKGMDWVTEASVRVALLLQEDNGEYSLERIQSSFVGFKAGYETRCAE